MTFREPAVREVLSRFALVKLDIDAPENRALCQKYHRQGGVPEFAILNASGRVQLRWVGAPSAENLIERLREVSEAAPKSDKTGIGRHRELAEYYIRRGDRERSDEQLAAIRRLDPDDSMSVLRDLLWLECETLGESSLWEQLTVSTRRYLDEFPADPGEEDAKVLLGQAQVETGGVATPELMRRIEELIEVMGVGFPRPSLLGRIQNRLFGRSKAEEQAADEWVETANETSARLRGLGRAASGPLREALLGPNVREARRVARVLGRMRLPETRAFLLEAWEDQELAMETRYAIAVCMGAQKDSIFLDLLVACLQSEEEHFAVRVQAALSIRDLVVNDRGTAQTDVARAVEAGLRHGNRKLRTWCLQLAFYVNSPMCLDLILELLSDRRSSFEEYRICDNALAIFCRQIGKEVRGGDDDSNIIRCEPGLAAFLKEWCRTPGRDLRWNPVRQSYQEH